MIFVLRFFFQGTHKLVEFLTQQQETATHFLVGVNILNNPEEFMAIFNQGGDMAVHTYTHPYMTSLTNEQVAAQLGWTMEIIRNSTGGRIPKYWRPPFGDSDNRVRAIAEEVSADSTPSSIYPHNMTVRFSAWRSLCGTKSECISRYDRLTY